MVSTRPLISKSSSPCIKSVVILQSAPIIIIIIIIIIYSLRVFSRQR